MVKYIILLGKTLYLKTLQNIAVYFYGQAEYIAGFLANPIT